MFKDRHDAGIRLSEKLASYKDKTNTMVLGLPRGGVIVAYEVAHHLHLPLDVIVIRKMGAPYNPELAIGATDEMGNMVLNEEVISGSKANHSTIEKERKEQMAEAQRRLDLFRHGRSPLDLSGKNVIIIDDGLATGATMRAAVHSVKNKNAKQVIVAIPVAAPSSLQKLEKEADTIIYLVAPDSFESVGNFYEHFEQTTDEEVIACLKH